VSWEKAAGDAKDMKNKFGQRLDVKIFTLDSEDAKPYAHGLRGSTNVLLDNQWVPLDVGIDRGKMEDFLY
jgi:hypothetical protein